ncbi:uncharacterized protein itprid1 [Melanotaenia boesemani]|uniref:uncharacterized protein itprid1 n=1 Tax=Melanotaenia boesemani TaxID=1250792 RepID=UPI001C048F9F|nr:uncharacterized protein itprid1 [Melanotaenia boesemani]
MEMNGTQNDSPSSSSVLYDQLSQVHCRTEEKPSHGQTEGLVLVFETSVDDSDDENGDVDAFCQQLDTDDQVYWAEPVHVTPISEGLSSHEDSDRFQFLCNPAAPDSLPATGEALTLPRSSSAMSVTDKTTRNTTGVSDKPSSVTPAPFPSPCPTLNFKQPIPSVSVSMSSVLSSHIVSRKDVPFRTESHLNIPHRILPLDTSTPLRAVQSWADLRIQRIPLTKNLSHRSVQTIPNSLRAAEATKSPLGSFLVPQPGPLMSNEWRSHEFISKTGQNNETVSVSTRLWADIQEDVGTNKKDQNKLWEASQTVTRACCCHCDHRCPQKPHSKQHSGNFPYSLDELEEMMLCLQQFRSVFSDIEEQSCEDQAAVYSVFSTTDREDAQSLEKLRCAVKLEAGELEMQLKELAHHYDESLKAKMHTLLDEQHLLCSQVLPPQTAPTSSPGPNRTVSSPDRLLQDAAWNKHSGSSTTQVPPASMDISESQGPPPSAADKLDFLGLLQRVGKSCIH